MRPVISRNVEARLEQARRDERARAAQRARRKEKDAVGTVCDWDGETFKHPQYDREKVFQAIGAMERSLDDKPRRVIPTDRIDAVSDRIETGADST